MAFYVGGFLSTLFSEADVILNPAVCIRRGVMTLSGLQASAAAAVLFFAVAVLIVFRGKGKGEEDERNFLISEQGTYGTAGFMKQEELSQTQG